MGVEKKKNFFSTPTLPSQQMRLPVVYHKRFFFRGRDDVVEKEAEVKVEKQRSDLLLLLLLKISSWKEQTNGFRLIKSFVITNVI